MENYYEKFIKYKSKYLKLLNQLNMKGGGPNDQLVVLNPEEKIIEEVTTVANYENNNLIVSSDVAMDLIKSTHKLNENIRNIEKNLGFFLNSGNISIHSNSYQSIVFSIKNKIYF